MNIKYVFLLLMIFTCYLMACQNKPEAEKTTNQVITSKKTVQKSKTINLSNHTKIDTIEILLGDEMWSNINWGKVDAGLIIKTYFILKNTTDSTLTINRIRTGDGGCYVYQGGDHFKEITLAPNEQTSFRLEQLTQGRRNRIHKDICIFIDDAPIPKRRRCFEFNGWVVRSD